MQSVTVNPLNISEILMSRLLEQRLPFKANDNISAVIQNPQELEDLQELIADKLEELFRCMVIDIDNDHNTKESAARIAKMYVREVFAGRYLPQPKLTDFPNAKQLDEIVITGPITLRSACSHHFVPITGKCWIGFIPGERVIGLSKFNRIVEWIAARPQIQEELVIQIADYLEQTIKPKGLAVVIEATHMCMTWRGVRESAEAKMVNSVMRGVFREDQNARNEFLSLIKK